MRAAGQGDHHRRATSSWNPDFGPEWSSVKVAQLRHRQGTWALYWPDSSGRWHEFDEIRPTKTIGPLLGVIQADPTGIFWG